MRALTPQAAARATARTLKAVWERRKKLKVNPAGWSRPGLVIRGEPAASPP